MSSENIPNPARALPSVTALLAHPECIRLVETHGHGAVVGSLRETLDALRTNLRAGAPPSAEDCAPAAVLQAASARLAADLHPRLKRVVNATGIILHTGLGRAVMPEAAARALAGLTGCCNVQMDLHSGERVHREDNLRHLVQAVTGAEDCLVVNNNAGATMLVLRALAASHEAVVSRGELIEIGGSFRLPDIMRESGAILKEVGTTNKTHPRDYEEAIGPATALLLKAHKSNYKIIGFTRETTIGEIAAIGHRHQVPVVDDLGCGALVPLERYGLEHEMTVRESLEAGADLVLCSTDKLIGGPQGGLIAGRRDLIQRIRKHPLYRVLRVCKLTLAALEATLRTFTRLESLDRDNPTYRMLARPLGEQQALAGELARAIAAAKPAWQTSVCDDISFLGGGSLPATEIPSAAVRITSRDESTEALSLFFRTAPVPVIPHIRDGAVLLNMRTVLPEEKDDVLLALAREGGREP